MIYTVDDYAPLVFVNDADCKAAQMFTAAHELAHIFVWAEGVPALNRTRPTCDYPKEQFCNKIAAEFLIPADALDKFLSKNDACPKSVTAHFKVSVIMAARRMLDAGAMSQTTLINFLPTIQGSSKRRKEQHVVTIGTT